jgi:hypothetical protein
MGNDNNQPDIRKEWFEHFVVDAGEYGKLTCSYDLTGVRDTFTKHFEQYFGAESGSERPDVLLHVSSAFPEFLYRLQQAVKEALVINFNCSVESAKLLFNNSHLAHRKIGNNRYPTTALRHIAEDGTEATLNFPEVQASDAAERVLEPIIKATKERLACAPGRLPESISEESILESMASIPDSQTVGYENVAENMGLSSGDELRKRVERKLGKHGWKKLKQLDTERRKNGQNSQ